MRKLCRKLIVCLRLTKREPVLDCKVLTFDVAKVAKRGEQCLLKIRIGGRREIAETRVLRLLRARHHRPRRRSYNRLDEIASSHEPLPEPHRPRLLAINSGHDNGKVRYARLVDLYGIVRRTNREAVNGRVGSRAALARMSATVG
jgi:hypothetical protein